MPTDLIGVATEVENVKAPEPVQLSAPTNLLDMEESKPEKKEEVAKPESSLLDLGEPSPSKMYQTSVEPQQEVPQSIYSTSVVQNSGEGSSFNFLDAAAGSKNIVVPYVPVISESDASRENKYTGLGVKAAFQR